VNAAVKIPKPKPPLITVEIHTHDLKIGDVIVTRDSKGKPIEFYEIREELLDTMSCKGRHFRTGQHVVCYLPGIVEVRL
jgi:hypothetical protein